MKTHHIKHLKGHHITPHEHRVLGKIHKHETMRTGHHGYGSIGTQLPDYSLKHGGGRATGRKKY